MSDKKQKMADENLMYVNFESSEAMAAKRDFLSSQVNLLKIAKAIKGYNFYRGEELELKAEISKRIKDLNSTISRLQKALPKPKTPEILQKVRKEKQEYKTTAKKGRIYEKSIDEQLREIEAKLNQLQSRSV